MEPKIRQISDSCHWINYHTCICHHFKPDGLHTESKICSCRWGNISGKLALQHMATYSRPAMLSICAMHCSASAGSFSHYQLYIIRMQMGWQMDVWIHSYIFCWPLNLLTESLFYKTWCVRAEAAVGSAQLNPLLFARSRLSAKLVMWKWPFYDIWNVQAGR